MQFLYHKLAGLSSITIEKEDYRYIFKVRRHKLLDILPLRNLQDNSIYFYRIGNITKKEAMLSLKSSKDLVIKAKKDLHIGWCIIETKIIEKTLAMLNEIGVKKISFIYCERSQKNFKIDLKRLKKIVINSSQQCGRSKMMELEVIDNTKEFLRLYSRSAILDFSGKNFSHKEDFESILVGCEGGFSENERKLFENRTVYGFDSKIILKSESAVASISSICLL